MIILTRLRNPNNDPIKVNGTETPNHKNSNATSVENGIAAELSFVHNTKFIIKNKENTTLKILSCFNINHKQIMFIYIKFCFILPRTKH